MQGGGNNFPKIIQVHTVIYLLSNNQLCYVREIVNREVGTYNM